MKALQIASGDSWAGAERVLAVLARGFSEATTLEQDALLLNEGTLAEELRRQNVSVEIIDESRRSFFGLVADLRRKIRDTGCDVVHAHRYKEILMAALAGRPASCRLVVTVHGLQPWRQIGVITAAQVWLSLWVARWSGAVFVAVSSELEARLGKLLGKKRVVRILNPLPPAAGAQGKGLELRSRLGWPEDQPVIGFVGRLEPVKGPDLLLEIAARSPAEARFVLVGDGSMREALEADVRARGLGDRVAFTGEVPSAGSLLSEFDALAMTSRHEGLPMVLLEAAAADVPVVAFNVGGVGEVLETGPGTRLVPAEDVDAFARALAGLIGEDDTAREAAARWGASVRQTFSLERAISDYLDVYRGGASRSIS